ncbi:mannose-6-phosphate isomerase, class I [Actinoallomurus liliacearum]|uniref:mannose-6-phosphate isomerase n=1 Tax=Actinoallomurus liliacearum TaxID=1080073 RepID=A0ABP8TR03_9ACTN
MHVLENPVQEYAWGSHTVLADLLGRPSPTERPQAELWIGAHPAAPSRLPAGASLGEHIAADPEGALGPAALARFGPRLPFLLKVLAIAAPLSLQVHPDREQAERGYAAERTPPGDPARNYKDDWPKPELLCALTDVHALCGLRDPGESAELLGKVPALRPVADLLAAGDVRAAVRTVLTWPDADRVVPEAVAVAGEPYASLAERYPGDTGVILAMLLNEVRLAPGQAMYVPPRVPHAYLSGTAVELMAGSDNVLRAGLTPKHVDVPELLNVASFDPGRPDVLDPVRTAGEEVYLTPAPEFRLSRVDAAAGAVLPAGGPQLLLCTEGRVELRRGGDATELTRGRAAFAEHRGGPIEVTGSGTLFRASLPET